MIVTVGILLVIGAAVSVVIRGRRGDIPAEWDGYLASKIESTERLLGPMARSFSRSGAVHRMATSSQTPHALRRDLELGGAFGGSLHVYYSMQLAALVTGSAMLALAFLDGLNGLNRFAIFGIGLIVAIWPYNKVRSTAKKRRQEVLDHLPEFADLLLMVLSSVSVPQAIQFTAERSSGPVAAEMLELARGLLSRTMPEEQVFNVAAARIGTPEGREFIASLRSSYLEGTAAVDTIRAQATNLRMLKYQQQRAAAKRLPVSLVITFAVHFMPLLFILAFLPVLSSLAGLQ